MPYTTYVQTNKILSSSTRNVGTVLSNGVSSYSTLGGRKYFVNSAPYFSELFHTTTFPDPILTVTPWCRVLLEQLTGLQLVKRFPAFYGTPRFITALTSVRHLSLSWASPIQSTCPHPTSSRSILILSTHLRLGLPSCLFPSGFPTKTLNTPSSHP